MGVDLVIVHLYPDLLRTYGDRGNVLVLQRRAEWRGFSVEVVPVLRGEAIPSRANLIFLGGGSDRVQTVVAADLLSRREALAEATSKAATILGVCGGYQLLGNSYTAADGTAMQGLGLLDLATVAGTKRMIGRVRAHTRLNGRSFELVGFENHGGRSYLGGGAGPLAKVPVGQGNNGEDGTEGAVQGAVIGTYLHGPLLPANPAFADALLEAALAARTGGEPLTPLVDDLEDACHRQISLFKR
jgi:lipid II isoglutaminyl synthase (glutamine-hydrolysing)